MAYEVSLEMPKIGNYRNVISTIVLCKILLQTLSFYAIKKYNCGAIFWLLILHLAKENADRLCKS